MVSESEKRHMRNIAAAEDELNREAIRSAASRSPSENIALAFELSEFASEFGGALRGAEDEVAPVTLWRARKRQTGLTAK